MSTRLNDFFSYGKAQDGTNYCAGVDTLAENVIEDNEQNAALFYPSKTGFATLRSSAYRMTTENAEAHLPLPIYKVNKFFIKLPKDLTFNGAVI